MWVLSLCFLSSFSVYLLSSFSFCTLFRRVLLLDDGNRDGAAGDGLVLCPWLLLRRHLVPCFVDGGRLKIVCAIVVCVWLFRSAHLRYMTLGVFLVVVVLLVYAAVMCVPHRGADLPYVISLFEAVEAADRSRRRQQQVHVHA